MVNKQSITVNRTSIISQNSTLFRANYQSISKTNMNSKPKHVARQRSLMPKNKKKSSNSQHLLTNQVSGSSLSETSSSFALNNHTHYNNLPSVRQIEALLTEYSSDPATCLKELIRCYQQKPLAFFQTGDSLSGIDHLPLRLIFLFVKQIIKYHDYFPVLEREKTIKVFEDFLRIIVQESKSLTAQELQCIDQINTTIWKSPGRELETVVLNGLRYLLKAVVQLGKANRSGQLHLLSIKLVDLNVKQLIITLQGGYKNQTGVIKDILFDFLRAALENVAFMPFFGTYKLPIFDMMALSLTSSHAETYQLLLSQMFNLLKGSLEDKPEEDRKPSAETIELPIKMIFLVSHAFNAQSIFAKESQKSYYSKQIIFLILQVYKPNLIRIIDELEKIDRNSIQRETIRSIFELATIGSSINRSKTLKEIVSTILASSSFKNYLPNELMVCTSIEANSQQFIETTLKAAQKSMFQLLYRLQKALSLHNLAHFMDLYVQNPITFRSEYFIESLFQNQPSENITTFMAQFTTRWALVQVKHFDFNFYLLSFFKKCVGKDSISLIAIYLKQLSVQELLKINSVIFRLSFEEDKKKVSIPEPMEDHYQLASLTSAGFSDRYTLINKMLPIFSQQLVWKEVISFIQPSIHYMYVKAFYNVANYEFTFKESCFARILQIVENFESAIHKQRIEDVYASFHLLVCICFKKQEDGIEQGKNKQLCEERIFNIIIERSEELLCLCEIVCERRRTAMSHVVLSSQLMNENIRYFEKTKRMHNFFLKSVAKWMQRLIHVDRMVKHPKSYEQVIEISQKLAKDVQFSEFHLVRSLSNLCSQKYFSNILETKIKRRVLNREMLSINYILMMREVLLNLIQKYSPEDQHNHYCIAEEDIMQYFLFVLSTRLTNSNEREILKSKQLILDTFTELTQFFVRRPEHGLNSPFRAMYRETFREIVTQVAVQNPEFVSKYERELIVHLRIGAIQHILAYFGTVFSVLDGDSFFSFIFELCFDKLLEIRLLIVNILTSRFKNERFECLLAHRYHVTAYLTSFAIFDPSHVLSHIANKVLEAIKKAGDDVCCLGLIILLHSSKLIFNHLLNSLLREEYHLNIDYFLRQFDSLWLSKKQWEYAAYCFSSKYLSERNLSFITAELTYRSHIQTYITSRDKSDFILESEIKEYLRNDFELSFEVPPEEPQVDFRMKFISNVISALPYRFFSKLKNIISAKSRPSRVIKGRKDIKIDWGVLQEAGLIRWHSEIQQPDKVRLSLI